MAVSTLMFMGIFGVRNDKIRGLLIETLETSNGNEYFFKHHDQPLINHCPQIQIIVKAANVRRARKLHIDMTQFLHEYIRASDSAVMFRATKLKSVVDQVEKVYTMRINKEIGIAKRQQTVAANKQAKIVATNQKILSRFQLAENEFQAERARRIDQLFGGSKGQASGAPKSKAPVQQEQADGRVSDSDMEK